jgi:hypothetical protein
MKRQVTVEQEICDICERNQAWHHCLGCGKAICYDCAKTAAVEYPHAVSFSGSDDGRYCTPCDQRLAKGGDELHAAYQTIRSLRNEQAGWYASFRDRSEAAEAVVKRLITARKQARAHG